MIRLLLLFYFSLFIISCSSSKKLNETIEETPHWLKEFPISQTHYIGIGLADKSKFPTDYIKIAQKNALQNLVSQIKVNISSQSQMVRMQKELNLKQDINSFIKLKTEDIIEGYEIIDTYTKGNEYWVYYSLNKELYKEIKVKKIEIATEKSKVLLQNALESSNLKNKYIYFVSALGELEPYFNESFITDLNGRKVNLKSEIISQFRSYMNNYLINSTKDKISIDLVHPKSKINFQLMHNNKPAPNVAIDVISKSFDLNTISNQTDFKGFFSISINKIKEIEIHHSIELALNFKTWLNEAHTSEFIKSLFEKITVPSFTFPIKINAPNFRISSTEKQYSNNNNRQDLLLATQEKLTSIGMKITESEDEAQLHIVINGETKKGSHIIGHKMYTSFLKMTFQIYDQKSHLIFSKTIDEIKGIQLSYEKSEINAYSKGKLIIKDQIIPEFFENL